eukprot:127362-Chlamydomonas_euryale.AAC.1
MASRRALRKLTASAGCYYRAWRKLTQQKDIYIVPGVVPEYCGCSNGVTATSTGAALHASSVAVAASRTTTTATTSTNKQSQPRLLRQLHVARGKGC